MKDVVVLVVAEAHQNNIEEKGSPLCLKEGLTGAAFTSRLLILVLSCCRIYKKKLVCEGRVPGLLVQGICQNPDFWISREQ